MSHEVETMAYANATPWHGIGTNVDQHVSVDAMAEAAGLNWRLNLLPMEAETPEGDKVAVPGRYALVRDTDNKVMTVTGASWKPLQPKDTLNFMREYVEAGGAQLETAGSLRGGKVVWGLANLNAGFEVSRGDKVNGYLLITSPNEVGKSISVRTTTVRVVCANTLAMAEGGGEVHHRQSHLREFDVEAAKEKVAEAHETLAEAERRAKTLNGLKMNLEDAVKKVFVPRMFPDVAQDSEQLREIMDQDKQPKVLRELIDSVNNAPGATPNNGWGVLNGFTHWADHVAGRSQESRLYRAWMGDHANDKLAIERRLMELAS
jgi:phage/plasmid-like protein (TIGR03299 family)